VAGRWPVGGRDGGNLESWKLLLVLLLGLLLLFLVLLSVFPRIFTENSELIYGNG
jgi:uncharacterized protein YpmS